MKLMNSNKKLSVRVSFAIIALSLGLIFYAYSQSAYAISMNINLGGNDYHTIPISLNTQTVFFYLVIF
jgi:hypothetical protein